MAKLLHHMENKLHKDYLDYGHNLNRFKSKIKKPNGKLDYKDIKNLNTVYKKEYVK